MIHIYLFDPDPAEQIEVGQIVVLAATLILRPLVAASFHRRQFLQRPHLARRRAGLVVVHDLISTAQADPNLLHHRLRLLRRHHRRRPHRRHRLPRRRHCLLD